ncbi:hypothetical protein D3C87_498800 [compost metagenome]
MDKATYDEEARQVIETICSSIIESFNFAVDTEHIYMHDGVFKVLVKNDLMISFVWDYMEAQIIWNFKSLKEKSGYTIDYRNIHPENAFYHGLKSFRKYASEEKPSDQWDRFIPKAIEKSYLDFLQLWISSYPELFETGNYELIRHLEKHGHQSAESMKVETELVSKLLNERTN